MDALPVSIAEPAPLLAGAATAAILCWIVGRRMIAKAVLPDHPNGRSSHKVATPRSGGIAIFVAFSFGFGAATALSSAPAAEIGNAALFTALAAGAFLLGLADDRATVGAASKLLGQIVIAGLFVGVFGGLQSAPTPGGALDLGVFGAPLSMFWIVAVMNAFNFMDGINGIAGACGAIVLSSLALLAAASGAPFHAATAAILAIALAAFLPLNFPRGRIFMGDGGSQLVGFLIAALALAIAGESGASLALAAPLALAPFLADVAFTLAHRLWRRRNIFAAHREHAYQLLVRMGFSQVESTAAFAAATLLCCAAAAIAATLAPPAQWTIVAVAYGALFALALTIFLTALDKGLLTDAPDRGRAPGSGPAQNVRATEASASPASASV